MKNNKKGNATVYLIIFALIAIAVTFMFIRLNWRRFKAEASFGFTVAGVIIAVLLIRKARKEKAKELARLEKERLEQERIAAGGKPSTLGDGKLEMNDVSEVAGKAMDKIDKFLEGGE